MSNARKNKPLSVKVKNPMLLFIDAQAFHFKVTGDRDGKFWNQFHDVSTLRKYATVSFMHVATDKDGGDTFMVLSSNNKAMLELYERLPKMADKLGCTLRNLAPSKYRQRKH